MQRPVSTLLLRRGLLVVASLAVRDQHADLGVAAVVAVRLQLRAARLQGRAEVRPAALLRHRLQLPPHLRHVVGQRGARRRDLGELRRANVELRSGPGVVAQEGVDELHSGGLLRAPCWGRLESGCDANVSIECGVDWT